MQQRLLVKFSCNPHINILLRDLLLVLLLVFVTGTYLCHRRQDIQFVASPPLGHIAKRVAIMEDRLV